MFSTIAFTRYPPSVKPILIWDGECGFCKYWVTRWQQKTGDSVIYKTYQEAGSQFPDIPIKEFKKASRLIEPDGRVYSGPDSAYRSLSYTSNTLFPWHIWYVSNRFFQKLSDAGYTFISRRRPFFFTLTKLFFGKDPTQMKPFWALYLIVILALLYVLLYFL